MFSLSLVSSTAPRQSFKDAAIASAKQRKTYTNPPPVNNTRPDEPGTPPHHSGDDNPSPYKKTVTTRKAPPAKEYDQAFTVDDDVRVFPPHKPKAYHVKDTSNSSHSLPEPDTAVPVPVPNPAPTHINTRKAIKKFILKQPAIIDHPISSLDFPEIFTQTYAPPIYQTDIVSRPMNSQTLSTFMAGQIASDRSRPCYDAAAVEDTLGFVVYLITHFFHERPHACSTEVEDRAALLTELNIVMRTLFSLKEDPHYKLAPFQFSSAYQNTPNPLIFP